MSEETNAAVAEQPVVEEQVVETPETESETTEAVSETAENTETLQDAVEEAIEEGATEEEVKELIKEFQLKVNGKTFNKSINLNDEEALKKELQMAAAGRQAMQEAAELKKLYSNEINRLKESPWEVFKELGLDPDELAEMRIQQRIEEMKKSPEQIEREQLQKELEDARKQLEAEQKRAQEAEMARLQEQAAASLDEEISNALTAHPEIPNSEYGVKKIADVMLWAIDQGWSDVTVEDVIPTVKAELKKDINRFMTELPEDFLESYIGQKNINRLREKRIKAAKTVENTANIKKTVAKEEKPKDRPKMKIEDWMRS